jgi:hypothetical protein
MTILLTQNSKLKKTSLANNCRVYNFGIPAQSTCLWAKDCVKYCYAKKGAYAWSNVKPAFERRLQVTKTDSFISLMITEIIKKKATHIRIHDSGDFYSREYLHKWFKIMESLPDVTFYAYSKSLPLLEKERLPKNFTLIKSLGGKADDRIDFNNDRHAKIFKSIEEMKRAGYANASDNDLVANGNNHLVGLLAH